MVYFSAAPVAPQSLDPTQYAALGEFKDWCFGQGLIESYDNISDCSEKFRRHLQIKVRDNSELAKGASQEAVDSLQVYSFEQNGTVVERLPDEAQRLLIEAAKDQTGTVMHVRYLDGQAIQTNRINFADSKDWRSLARWETALEQLQSEELIVECG